MNYNLISSNTTSTTSASASSTSSSSSPKSQPDSQHQQQQHPLQAQQQIPLSSSSSSSSSSNTTQGSLKYTKNGNRLKYHVDSYRNNVDLQQTTCTTLGSNQTTAYLVQTIDGNTLLIPQSTSFMHNSNNQNSINRSPIEILLQQQQQQQQQHLTSLVTTAPPQGQLNFDNRPESVLSNVYQTIEADRNGCMYTSDGQGFYDTSTFKNTFKNQNKYKQMNLQHLYQLQQQQQQQLLIQQNPDTLKYQASVFGTSTAKSSTLEPMSTIMFPNITLNRRHDKKPFLSKIHKRLQDKLKSYCSWKMIAILFLVLVFSLLSLIIYLTDTNVKTKNSVLFLKIGDTIEDQMGPNELFNLQFYIDQRVTIKFNITAMQDKTSMIGVYGDKNTLPTFTRFKFFETLNGGDSNGKQTGFVQTFDDGLWYLAILNDNHEILKFRLKTEILDKQSSPCKLNCNGKGDCVDGKCKCVNGHVGEECSQSVCPVLCNGHGKYTNGQCVCDSGWHGFECSLSAEQCEVADCNGHGECVDGECQCKPGFDGRSCDQETCLDRNCSNNGVCVQQKCKCFNGYTGESCESRVSFSDTICSNKGQFDFATKSCVCQSGWTGVSCANNDKCVDSTCGVCKYGWRGLDCQDKIPFMCDSKCSQHGVCSNGTCVCSHGFQGRNCQTNNCQNSCNSHGICEKTGNQYQCVCSYGWTGAVCDTAIEMICNDEVDNDKDGLIDCMDSECCSSEYCKLSASCNTSPEPKDRLLRKQPPSITATFFEKMKFLIEDGSVQLFANSNIFAESQVSVIRGQVLFKNGQPLIGVKVSASSNPAYGYTLTRQNGIFDLMVNGGGALTLQFSRTRLRTQYTTVNVLWNQFAYIDNVVMYLHDDDMSRQNATKSPCPAVFHDNSLISPIVRTTWKEIRTHYYDTALCLPDQGVVRNEVKIMDTNLKLVYLSQQANGFNSIVYVLLTSSRIPDQLQTVHLKILVEGVLSRFSFDAYENLYYEYAWDRRNAYEQRVYGFTFAKVSIGYEYENCDYIYWHDSVVKLNGFDLITSEIGNWNIDVHHKLNYQQGILHKGDGTTVYLKDIQKQIEIAGGQLKTKRDVLCATCDGADSLFYEPYSLSINKDGVVFIGDYNYIWMLNNTEPAKRILELRADQPYKYNLANDPINGYLYITDPARRQMLNVKQYAAVQDLKQNFNLEYGTGLYCSEIVDDETDEVTVDCGDGDSGRNMKMTYPKGFDFDSNGNMYFIDGTRIRLIDADGKVQTVIQKHSDVSHTYKPDSCNKTYTLNGLRLFWPTSLAVSPLDNTVYVLDDEVIYKITNHKTVTIVAGVPHACSRDEASSFTRLISPIDMAFNSEGDLYVLENDRKSFKQIRVLKSNGEMDVFFSSDDRRQGTLDFDQLNVTTFNDPIAIAVHPNRSIYVLDKGDNVLYHVKHSVNRNESNGRYSIVSPETRESYVFNRFGLHLSTIDLVTGNVLYNFTYNGNALYGKLIAITDQSRRQLVIKRDFHGRAESLRTPNNYLIRLKLNAFDALRTITPSDNKSVNFNYLANTGLITAQTEPNGDSTVFAYEKNGRVKEIIDQQSNMMTSVAYTMNASGIVVQLSRDADSYTETWIVNDTVTYVFKNQKLDTTIERKKFTVRLRSLLATKSELNSFKVFHKTVRSVSASTHRQRLIQIKRDLNRNESTLSTKSLTSGGDDDDNTIFSVNGDVSSVRVDFNKIENVETYSDATTQAVLFRVHYNGQQQPVAFESNQIASTNLTYDKNGKLAVWERGTKLKEEYVYDIKGRLIEIKYNDGGSLKYSYSEGVLPIAITLPNRDHYVLHRDEIGDVQQIITPKQQRHRLIRLNSLTTNRVMYFPPEFQSPFVWVYNKRNQLIQHILPSNYRIQTYDYANDGNLRAVYYDNTKVQITRDESKEKIVTDEYTLERTYTARNTIQSVKLLNSEVLYAYSQDQKVTSLQLTLKNVVKSRITFEYSSKGQLKRVNEMEIVYGDRDSVVVKDSNVQLTINRNEYLSVSRIELKFRHSAIGVSYEYDEKNRLSRVQYTSAQQANKTVTYEYDQNDRLVEVLQSSESKWRVTYDSHGNAIAYNSTSINGADQLITISDDFTLRYAYDKDGFVYKRVLAANTQDIFVYSSQLLLKKVKLQNGNRPQPVVVEYTYDDQRRLIVRDGHLRLFYTNQAKPFLITHIYDESTGHALVLHYTDDGLLFAIERNNDETYYVICDLFGTPVYLYDSMGRLVNEFVYDVFGRQLQSRDKFDIYIGYRGWFYDHETGVVFSDDVSRPYDTLSGRYLVPNVDLVGSFLSNPTSVNLYQPAMWKMRQTDADVYKKNMDSWLQYYRHGLMQNRADVDLTEQTDVSWCRSCFLNKLNVNFNLKFKSSNIFQTSKLNTIYSNLNVKNDVLMRLANQQERYEISSANTIPFNDFYLTANRIHAKNLTAKNAQLSQLLDQTVLLQNVSYCVFNGIEIVSLVKMTSNMNTDLRNLTGFRVTRGLNDLSLQTDYTIVNVTYTNNGKESSDHLINSYSDSIKQQAERILWEKERYYALELNEYPATLKTNEVQIDNRNKFSRLLCDPNSF